MSLKRQLHAYVAEKSKSMASKLTNQVCTLPFTHHIHQTHSLNARQVHTSRCIFLCKHALNRLRQSIWLYYCTATHSIPSHSSWDIKNNKIYCLCFNFTDCGPCHCSGSGKYVENKYDCKEWSGPPSELFWKRIPTTTTDLWVNLLFSNWESE